ILDRQILHRLHVQSDALDVPEATLEATNDPCGIAIAFALRLQVDQHPPAVERRVLTVDADERRQAFDGGIVEDRARQCLLALGHRIEVYLLLRIRDSVNDAGY